MIIYENTIAGFLLDSKGMNRDLLITKIKANMKHKMGRGVSNAEERSWRTTLIKASKLFETIQEKNNQYILLEFKIPYSQKRIDVILVGSDGTRKTLLIIELKGWSKSYISDRPGQLEIDTNYRYVQHPNREADEYKYLLTNKFDDINKEFQDIRAVSLLPNYEPIKNDPILSKEFESILKTISLYTSYNTNEFVELLEEMFVSGIKRKSLEFLNKLEYKPSLDFQEHIAKEYEKIRLTNKQEDVFRYIVSMIKSHIQKYTNKKLILISGMPGSGKTVVAFKILAYIYHNLKITAKLQLPGPEFKEAAKRFFDKNDFRNMIGGAYGKGQEEIQIIDEAHKAKGNVNAKGLYKILFENQNFIISLIDDDQVVNKLGITKDQMKEIASTHNFDILELKLTEQFRNSGDATYIDWLKNWIYKKDNQQEKHVNHSYDFDVYDEKEFNRNYKEMYLKNDVRMSSFWTQSWNAKFGKEGLPSKLIKVGTSYYAWNPNEYWLKQFRKNNPNKTVPEVFKRKILKKNFNIDKIGPEYIAYFNTIQGSEFDYMFVHLPKLFYLNKNNELDIDFSTLDMSEMRSQIWTKNHLPNPDKEELNKLYFKNRLLVSLTRGKKATYIYCEDKKLQEWIKSKIIKR